MAQTGTASMERTLGAVAMMAIWLAGAGVGMAAEPATPSTKPAGPPVNQTGETVVLDSNSFWRHFEVSRCAFARTPEGKLEPWDLTPFVGSKGRGESGRRYEAGWPTQQHKPATSTESSPLPPTNWTGVEMDDSDWPRVRLPQPGASPVSGRPQTKWGATAAVCLRGKFEVKDPARVKTCRLGLDYLGGVVVYVNGKEVVRRHLSGNKPDLLALAEDYPGEVFIIKGESVSVAEKGIDRGLRDFAIPTALLRRGVNVLAIEVHTAPLPLAYVKAAGEKTPNSYLPWMPIGLLRARLTVSPDAAVVPNASRPKGIQVWNSAPYETLSVFDFGDPCEPVRPVVIHAARNTAFSGRLVASSERPIKGLKVAVSDLAFVGPSLVEGRGERPTTSGGPTGSGNKIPASAVRVRYAVAVVPGELPTTEDAIEAVKHLRRNLSDQLSQGKSHLPVERFDGLLDTIPAEIPVSRAPVLPVKYGNRDVDRKSLTGGAVAPLWFTVRVPKDARAGLYQGQITIAAEGLAAVSVPLRVSVSDWVVPAPQDFRLCHLPVQLDYPVAWHYDIPIWSDKHFEMIGKAHALMAEAGSRQFELSLIVTEYRRFVPASMGYASLVRWIKQPDGKYKHDLTAFDKYLAMVAKSVGTPRPLRLQAWDYTQSSYSSKNTANSPPPDVSVFDPQTGKIGTMKAPDPGTDEAVTFWRPVFDDMLKRLKGRGWLDATALSWTAFMGGPDDSTIHLAQELWPQAVWFMCAHEIYREWRSLNSPWVKVRYGNTVYFYGEPGARGYQALLEPRPMFLADAFRSCWHDYSPLTHQRRTAEDIAMSGLDGVGDFGIDLFMYRSPNGEIHRTEHNVGPSGPGQSQMSMLYPGPEGPVATERYEMFREGVVMTEALLFIERAIQSKKLSAALQQRAEKALDARSHAFIMDWFAIRDMPAAEDAKLLALAGEVAREQAIAANTTARDLPQLIASLEAKPTGVEAETLLWRLGLLMEQLNPEQLARLYGRLKTDKNARFELKEWVAFLGRVLGERCNGDTAKLGKLLNDPGAFQFLQAYVRAAAESANGTLKTWAETDGAVFASAWSGLRGAYYHGTNFEKLAFERLDEKIDIPDRQFPYPDGRQDELSVRWTGFIVVKTPGKYTFHSASDDGQRVWVADQLLIDDWNDHGVQEVSGAIELTAGQHPFKVEFYQGGGGGAITVAWSGPGLERQVLGKDVLRTKPWLLAKP